MTELEKMTDAAAKLLAELYLIIPYLADSTQSITQGVIKNIINNCPNIPTDYSYCSDCHTQHRIGHHLNLNNGK